MLIETILSIFDRKKRHSPFEMVFIDAKEALKQLAKVKLPDSATLNKKGQDTRK